MLRRLPLIQPPSLAALRQWLSRSDAVLTLGHISKAGGCRLTSPLCPHCTPRCASATVSQTVGRKPLWLELRRLRRLALLRNEAHRQHRRALHPANRLPWGGPGLRDRLASSLRTRAEEALPLGSLSAVASFAECAIVQCRCAPNEPSVRRVPSASRRSPPTPASLFASASRIVPRLERFPAGDHPEQRGDG